MPRASVIIPAYHSHGELGACLRALQAQTFRDFEVIVVNSSAEEQTRALVTGEFPAVRFEQSPTRLLPHAARNRGVELASGELLIFTDPDCRARPDWLSRLVTACDAGHPVVGGAVVSASPQLLSRGVHLCRYPEQMRDSPAGPQSMLPTANVCYARTAWVAIGPFEGHLFCGDSLLSRMAATRGLCPWFDPAAVVEHREDARVIELLWRQRFSRGAEFAAARAALEGWSRTRAAVYPLVVPGRLVLLLARAARGAFRGGDAGTFILTLPLQASGQLAWLLGEASAQWRIARGSRRSQGGPSPERP